jgi:hypothetical protein
MFLVNETMVEWVNNEIYKKGFDTSLYFVRSYDEYEWGWIVEINPELPTLDIAFLNDKLTGTLFVHRNGYMLDEYSVHCYVIDDEDDVDFCIYDALDKFRAIAIIDRSYNWREFKDKGIPYKELEPADE